MLTHFDQRLIGLCLLAGTAGAQQVARDPSGAAKPASPAPTAGVLRPGDPLPAPKNFNRFAGAPTSLPATFDDAVPRPTTLQAQPGEHGDVVNARVEGDPYYLGFAAGKYFPNPDERLDPDLVARASTLAAAGQHEVHAFVMFGARMTPERLATLEAHGVRTLGFHPYYCMKAALPIDALDRIAALDFVRWIGDARMQQKVHPNLALAPIGEDGRFPVYIDVFESDLGPQSSSEPVGQMTQNDQGVVRAIDDPSFLPRKVQSNGPAQRALTALGVEIGEYVDSLHAFRARVLPGQVEALTALDFVQFVEPDVDPIEGHDESTPMIGNDIVRASTSGNGSNLIAIGHADSGYDSGHGGLSIYSWGWDFTGLGNAFADGCEHGTHTLGTILGSGYGSYGGSLKGTAPGLARTSGQTRAYIARIFNNTCGFSGTSLSSIMAVNRSGYYDGVYTSLKPVAINNSWGSPGTGWFGTEANPRAIDDEVFGQDQLYTYCAGNNGPSSSTIWQHATAKNAMTVGAVVDFYDSVSGFPGSVADFSSRGPCGDGRWKPNVVAPGEWIMSCDAGTVSGYRQDAGTSMATPHVTGVASEIADWSTWMRYWPASIASVLMSSAETKGGVSLTFPSDSHLRNYGTGRIEEHKAVLGSSDYYWNTWAFSAPWPNWQYGDFSVPANTKRITVCMNYYEGSASAGASQSLVNNWDLYIDDPSNGIDPAGNGGDWVVQQSTIDNCEIRTIDNPTVGTWRWKAWPQNIVPFSTVKMGVTVTFEIDTTSCNPYLDVSSGYYYLQPNQTAVVNAYTANYDGVATGVSLDTYSGANISGVYGSLFDGSSTNYVNNVAGGRQVELGDLPPYYARSADFYVSWPTEGAKNFGAYMDIDNYGYLYDSVPFMVDGTPPPLPTGFGSYTHTVGVWSQNPIMYCSWNVPSDNLSGIQGYAFAGATGYIPDPGYSLSFGNVATAAITLPSSTYGFYVALRPVDNCGNWNGGYVWNGPYYVDAVAPGGPTNVHSTSHSVGGTSCDSTIDVAFTPATDYESYIAGYAAVWDHTASTVVSTSLSLPWNATGATSPSLGAGAWYFHVRAQDYAGNWGTTQHLGPFNIAPSGILASYCTPKTNSLGCVPNLSFSGTPSATASSGFVVSCSNVLNQKSGQLIYSLNGRNNSPFQGGTLCVHSPVRRTVIVSSGGSASGNNCSGVFAFDFNAFARGSFITAPAPELSVPGTIVDVQWWGRDPGFAQPNNTSLSSGLEFVMCN